MSFRNESCSIEIGSFIRGPSWLCSILVKDVAVGNQREAISDWSLVVLLPRGQIPLYTREDDI